MITKVKRSYPVTQRELVENCHQLADFLRRDKVEVSVFLVNEEKVNTFVSQVQAFDDFTTDRKLVLKKKELVSKKNQNRKKLLEMLSPMLKLAKISNLPNLMEYQALTYTLQTDVALIQKLRYFTDEIEKHLNVLETYGLTIASTDLLKAKVLEFSNSILKVNNAIALRKNVGERRTVLSNKLYGEFRKFCEIGKMVWVNQSNAFYADYVFADYERPKELPPDQMQATTENAPENA